MRTAVLRIVSYHSVTKHRSRSEWRFRKKRPGKDERGKKKKKGENDQPFIYLDVIEQAVNAGQEVW